MARPKVGCSVTFLITDLISEVVEWVLRDLLPFDFTLRDRATDSY